MIRLAAFDPDAAGFSALLAESQSEGHRMVLRLAENWADGSNRFALPGEIMLGAWSGDVLVGVCGRNVEPYDPYPRAGRVRHLYVAHGARRDGVGRALISAICDGAAGHFDYLNTNAPETAFAFYERMGFVRLEGGGHATHRLSLAQ
ncbi:GNAT family N-acetyltransferase [Devosia sp.]|uniref:GNAT family N-acetyltransferase n=1 Tax=Devosia sp. TaxID=1871048 RepID=UPI0025FDC5FF|nr:GNAT family N-acetyltransferase [Devosia sp.]MCR6633267.1 GNAT family N-acetyltransferase [Devosia sp.]